MGKWLYIIIASCLLFFTCKQEEGPAVLPPLLTLHEVTDITRNTALLSAAIQWQEQGAVCSACFIYGTSETPDTHVDVEAVEGTVIASLSELQAGVDYYYYLEVSNGYSTVRSEIGTFRTLPNTLPVLGEMTLVYKGPFSAAVQCSVKDNGGEPLRVLGFKYRMVGATEELFVEARQEEMGLFSGKLSGLDMATTYIVRAYAANTLGEVFSLPLEVLTSTSIYNSVPGQLSEIVGEQKYNLSRVAIAGVLDGMDIRLLREMLGWDINGNATPGRLVELDLSDAKIVSGGNSFYASLFTAEDTLRYATFIHCSQLREIVLPHSLKVIEGDAFKGCSGLESVTIPDSVFEYHSSGGCSSLREFVVSALNTRFASRDGILYDKAVRTLLQYPEGKTIQSPFQFPSTVMEIAAGAFQNCLMDSIEVPATVTRMGEGVFNGAKLKKVVLGNGITSVPNAAFKGCTRLQTLVLGKEIVSLSNYCLQGCGLSELHLLASYPPVCYENTFFGVNNLFNQCTLYVPEGRKAIYRQNNYWGNFTRIRDIVP